MPETSARALLENLRYLKNNADWMAGVGVTGLADMPAQAYGLARAGYDWATNEDAPAFSDNWANHSAAFSVPLIPSPALAAAGRLPTMNVGKATGAAYEAAQDYAKGRGASDLGILLADVAAPGPGELGALFKGGTAALKGALGASNAIGGLNLAAIPSLPMSLRKRPGVDLLPESAEGTDQVKKMLQAHESGRYDVSVKPKRWDYKDIPFEDADVLANPKDYRYRINYEATPESLYIEHPDNPHIKYDPEVGEINAAGRLDVREGSGYSRKVPFEKEPGYIYRGISHEEMESIQRTGQIQSLGDANFQAQQGMTIYTEDPGTASSYAGAFADFTRLPATGKPGYVLKIKRPESGFSSDPNVALEGYELARESPIPASSIAEVSELRTLSPPGKGYEDLRRGDITDKSEWTGGNRSTPSGSYVFGQPRPFILDPSRKLVDRLSGAGGSGPRATARKPARVVKMSTGDVESLSKEMQGVGALQEGQSIGGLADSADTVRIAPGMSDVARRQTVFHEQGHAAAQRIDPDKLKRFYDWINTEPSWSPYRRAHLGVRPDDPLSGPGGVNVDEFLADAFAALDPYTDKKILVELDPDVGTGMEEVDFPKPLRDVLLALDYELGGMWKRRSARAQSRSKDIQ